MTNIRTKTLCLLISMVTASAVLIGCAESDIDTPAVNGGIGRIPASMAGAESEEADKVSETSSMQMITIGGTDDSYTPPPLDNGNNQETEAAAVSDETDEDDEGTGAFIECANGMGYKYENGKYYYRMPEPDRSGFNSAALNTVSRALFADQGEDDTGSWYFGKVKRNASTGEVTYVWDRYQSTIDLVKKYNGIYRGDETQKVCYLTFDCGYENGNTDKILDTLREKKVSGTFFVTSQFLKEAKDQVNRILNEGHIIGNHTVNHYNSITLTPDEFRYQIEENERILNELYDYDGKMLFWRPPQGAANEYVLAMADALGLYTVFWSFTQYDYDVDNQPEYGTALQNAENGLHNGCVYLLHNSGSTNAAILGELIDYIQGQGYEILPLCAAVGK